MKFAVLMLLGGSVCASSQNITSESQAKWSVSMDNDKFKGIAADQKALAKDKEKFIHSHPQVELEGKKLGKMSQETMKKLQLRLEKTAKLLDNPEYQAGINKIGAKMQALSHKVKKALKQDDHGLRVWNFHIQNQEFLANTADKKAVGRDVRKFIRSRPKIKSKLKVLTTQIHTEFQQIGQRLSETGAILDDPQQMAEIEAIGKELQALHKTFKANLHWDDEGQKMWYHSLNPGIEQQTADIARDIRNLDRPAHELGMELQKFMDDQEKNKQQISKRFQEAFRKLDSQKHRMQLEKFETRCNALQAHFEKEVQVIMGDLQDFVQQPAIEGELKDLEKDVSKELNDMTERYNQFQMQIDRELKDLDHKLHPSSKMDDSKCGNGKLNQMLRSEPVTQVKWQEYTINTAGDNWNLIEEKLSVDKIMSRSEIKLSESPCEIQKLEFAEEYLWKQWSDEYARKYYYTGSIKNGQPHGVGRLTQYNHRYKLTRIFEGQFKEGKAHGYFRGNGLGDYYFTNQYKEGHKRKLKYHSFH